MYIVIFGIFPIMVSSQVLVTDLIDAVNSEGKLIKYIEEESVPYTGKVYHYYNNGTKELQGNYVRGFKHGKWTWWHTNGKRHKVGFYTHSVEDSLWQWWFSKGQLKTRGKYNKGKKEGRWSEWYDNEKLMYSYTYKNNSTQV